eukprot:183551-Chlamydomonas_euryale.AAC.1
MYIDCTGVGAAYPRLRMTAATFGERENARNAGSTSCIAWPSLLMDSSLGCEVWAVWGMGMLWGTGRGVGYGHAVGYGARRGRCGVRGKATNTANMQAIFVPRNRGDTADMPAHLAQGAVFVEGFFFQKE